MVALNDQLERVKVVIHLPLKIVDRNQKFSQYHFLVQINSIFMDKKNYINLHYDCLYNSVITLVFGHFRQPHFYIFSLFIHLCAMLITLVLHMLSSNCPYIPIYYFYVALCLIHLGNTPTIIPLFITLSVLLLIYVFLIILVLFSSHGFRC